MNLNTYQKMLTHDGATRRERAVNKIHRDIYDLAVDNPAYHKVLINGEERYATIVSSLDPHIKKITAMPGERLSVGNHVRYCDHDYWITACSADDGIYAFGEMVLCNEVVRFISPLDHKTILEYPTLVTNTTKFNTGETPNKRLTLPSGQFSMLLPINEHTLLVDNNFRFLIDKRKDYPSAYRVTYVDPETYGYDDGLLSLILLQCELNRGTDNIDLMIADYWNQKVDDPPAPKISLDTTKPTMRIGLSKTFTPILEGDILTPLLFTVTMMDEIAPYVSYEKSDTSITFTVQNDMRLVGNVVNLSITDADGYNQYKTSIQIRGVV